MRVCVCVCQQAALAAMAGSYEARVSELRQQAADALEQARADAAAQLQTLEAAHAAAVAALESQLAATRAELAEMTERSRRLAATADRAAAAVIDSPLPTLLTTIPTDTNMTAEGVSIEGADAAVPMTQAGTDGLSVGMAGDIRRVSREAEDHIEAVIMRLQVSGVSHIDRVCRLHADLFVPLTAPD